MYMNLNAPIKNGGRKIVTLTEKEFSDKVRELQYRFKGNTLNIEEAVVEEMTDTAAGKSNRELLMDMMKFAEDGDGIILLEGNDINKGNGFEKVKDEEDYEWDFDDNTDYKHILASLILCNSKRVNEITKDLGKIIVDNENVDFDEWNDFDYATDIDSDVPNNGRPLMGYQLIDGKSFIGGITGGDWEEPVFFVVYWDGKNLRGYIPTKGNTFCGYLKAAFGSLMESPKIDNIPVGDCGEHFYEVEDGVTAAVKRKELLTRHKLEVVADMDDEKILNMDFNIHWQAIQEDVLGRLEVR